MVLARRLLTRSSALAVLVLWLLASFGSAVHDGAALHVECAEHGDIVEIRGDVRGAIASAPDHRASLHAADLDAPHQDGCSLPPVASLAPTQLGWVDLPDPPPLATPALTPRQGRWGRCALSFAPKTSPPQA